VGLLGLNGYLEGVTKASLEVKQTGALYGNAGACAAQGGAMYWSRNDALMKISDQASGLGSVVVVAEQHQPLHVAIDETQVFWVTAGAENNDGQLFHLAR